MTTLFSKFSGLFRRRVGSIPWGIALIVFVVPCASGQRIVKLGYVVSAKDRAQADTFAQQGFIAYQAGDYSQALNLLDQADRLKPDQSDTWNLRGMVFLRQKAYEKAQVAFARAVALDPNLWAAQFNLAETAFQQKDYVHSRKDFDNLLAQTDRFKDSHRWELVQYKAFLSCLLGGNAAEASRKLAKLPTTGGTTPAHLYAEAALNYQNKKTAEAQKLVASAQTAFPSTVNDLFADSLVQAGWQSAPLPSAMLVANNAPTPGTGLPPGVTLATDIPAGQGAHPYYVVDPKVEASAAEPLPLPDAGVHPIVGKITPAMQTTPSNAPKLFSKASSAPEHPVSNIMPVPEPTPDTALEHRDLLLVD